MLSSEKLKYNREEAGMTVHELAGRLVSAPLTTKKGQAVLKATKSNIRNWERGLYKPVPKRNDIENIARALSVKVNDLTSWKASHRFVPMAPRKVRLVVDLIRDRNVQDALDVLKFANKRATVYVGRVLESAIANAAEGDADVENLYVREARVDGAGIRRGTKRWRAKDRGRAVPWTKLASHIHISVEED